MAAPTSQARNTRQQLSQRRSSFRPVNQRSASLRARAQHQDVAELCTSSSSIIDRRAALAALALIGSAATSNQAKAVQGYIPGRIPGVSQTADSSGFYTYTRPEAKQGGHGVGWSEIPRYSFKIPAGWEETAVSIADLGGTEIDLRFANKDEGDLFVVVAPVLRFQDVGFNADVRIEELGSPDTIISGFAPELFGAPLDEGQVLAGNVVNKDGLVYYEWELKPHLLVTATAVRNRLFLLTVQANSRQWRKYQSKLKTIQESFLVQQDGVKSA